MEAERLQEATGASIRVRRKAEEYIRIASIRCPMGLGNGEVSKAAVCFELAAQHFNEAFDKEKAKKFSGADEKTYQMAFTALSNILGIKPSAASIVKDACIRYKCPHLVDPVLAILEQYKEKCLSNMQESRRGSADFGKPVFAVAALYLYSKGKGKTKLDRNALLQTTNTNSAEFMKVCKSMVPLCFPDLQEKIEKDKKRRQDKENGIVTEGATDANGTGLPTGGKRKRETDTEGGNANGKKKRGRKKQTGGAADEPEDGEAAELKKRRTMEYEKWKQEIAEDGQATTEGEEDKKASIPKQMKQPTLAAMFTEKKAS